MRTRLDGEVGCNGDDMAALGVVLALPAKKQFEVFDTAEHENDDGAQTTDDEHGFQNSRQHGDDQETHRDTMVFETTPVDQLRE